MQTETLALMNERIREFLHAPIQEESIANIFLFWLLISSLVLLLGPFTNYSPAGFIDPWVDTGYFTNFADLVHRFGMPYYPTRLPYILFGVLMYALFSPLVANFVINLAILTAGSTALYNIVARHQGRLVATVTALAFCFNPYVMSTISWDYPDGPAIAFFLLGLWLVLAPPKRLQGRLGVAVIGALWAMAGFTNLIIGLIILPALVLIAYLRRFDLRQVVEDGFYMAVGVVVTTAIFAIISKQIFGDYRFYEPQFKQFMYMNSGGHLQQMWGTGHHWLNTAYRVGATYGLTLVGGILFVRHFATLKSDRFYTGAYLFLFLSSAVFLLVEFPMKAVVLRVIYASSYLVVPLFVFLGALLGALRKIAGPLPDVSAELDLVLALMGAVVPVYLFSPPRIPPALQWQHDWPAVTVIAILGVLAGSLFGRLRFLTSAVAATCFALLISFPITVDPGVSYVFSDQRPAFEAAMRAQNVLTSGTTTDHTLRFWYDNDEHWSPLFASINSLYLWGWQDYSRAMPTMPVDDLRRLFATGTMVVHLTDNPGKVAERTQLMASHNILVEDSGNWTITAGNIAFHIFLQNVRDASAVK
jgi:hypothetical protein